MTTTQANINSASYRADYRPRPIVCEICHEAPAVRRVWHRDARNGSQWTASCCARCAKKA